jgi:hypothetical protein
MEKAGHGIDPFGHIGLNNSPSLRFAARSRDHLNCRTLRR